MKTALVFTTVTLALTPISAVAGMSCGGPYRSGDGKIVATQTEQGYLKINGTVHKMRGCGTGFYCSFEEIDGVNTQTKSVFLNVSVIPPEIYYEDPELGEITLVGGCKEDVVD